MATRRELTEDYSCGYCLQRLSYMVDPRELPCSHIFCMHCLQAEFVRLASLKCVTCGQVHELITENLKRVDITARTTPTGTPSRAVDTTLPASHRTQHLEPRALPRAPSTGNLLAYDTTRIPPAQIWRLGMHVPCDLCEEKSESVCFCRDCGKTLCDHHQKTHDEYSKMFTKKTHRTVDIEEYNLHMSKYKTEECLEHKGQRFCQVCKNCYKIFCLYCQTNTRCGANCEAHILLKLDRFAQAMREFVTDAMKSLSDKITEISRLELSAWSSLEDVEAKVKEMLEEVDTVAAEQISLLKLEIAETKREIQTYLSVNTQQVETYTSLLAAHKEHMQGLWSSTDYRVSRMQDAEMTRDLKENIAKLKRAMKAEFNQCTLSTGSLIPGTNMNRSLEVTFVEHSEPPSRLELLVKNNLNTQKFSEFARPTKSYNTARWTQENKIITCGYHNKIVLYDTNMTQLDDNKIDDPYYNIDSIVEHDSGYAALIFYINKNEKTVKLILISKALQITHKVDAYTTERAEDMYALAVVPLSSQIIVADATKLTVYSKNRDKLYSARFNGLKVVTGILALPDGCVLLSDLSAGTVSKHKLDPVLPVMWTCRGLARPTKISMDAAGYVYIASESEGFIYILSTTGNLLHRLTHQKLMTGYKIRDVSVQGELLAIIYGSTEIMVYRICRTKTAIPAVNCDI